ncbi:MAG TPA: ATP-binding protein [Acidimicrobiales bacterium]
MVVVGADRLARPWVAAALLAAALAVTVADTRAVAGGGPVPPWLVAADLVTGALLLAGEGLAFEEGHAFAGRQGLAGGWPVAGVIAAGVALGPASGAVAGGLVGLGRAAGAVANGVAVADLDGDRLASLASTVAFYALYGGVAGWVATLLGRAEQEVAVTRAREEVARTLHDGVLQTLALVERRTGATDPDLARLARDTDRDLRSFLHGRRPGAGPAHRLGPALREAALRAGRAHDVDVALSVVDEDAEVGEDVLAAVVGAVAEAVANVGKHAGVRRAVVFAEQDDDGRLFVSVRDDGRGFDPAAVPPDRRGLAGSVVGRVADAGGRAEVVSAPGRGTEVRIRVP